MPSVSVGSHIVSGIHQLFEETHVTTLPGRTSTALLIIDMQNGVVEGAHNRDGVISNINKLVDDARVRSVPIVWVQHSDEDLTPDSHEWQYVPELVRDEAEPLVHKHYGDSFEETDLESVLADRQVGRLIVTGAATDACIRATLHGAIVRGYDTTLVGDAHTTGDLSEYGAPPPDQVIAHTNLYWNNSDAPGRRAGTVKAKDVTFAGGTA
jgi:isochorismate hydrolase